MATELLIASNPSRRRRKMSGKQRAAALRNLKKARRARKGGSRRRRRNPVAANPTRRKRRRGRSFFRRIRRRRNPSLSLRTLSPRSLLSKVQPALVAGGGAVANDVLYSTLLRFVPDTLAFKAMLTSGPVRYVGKAVSAVLLGQVAGMVLPRRIADQMTTGALAVLGYQVVRDGVERFAPSLQLGMYLEPSLGYSGAGWNPTYGSSWREKSGLARSSLSAYLAPGAGGPRVPSQFSTADQFRSKQGMRTAPVYSDEFETGT